MTVDKRSDEESPPAAPSQPADAAHTPATLSRRSVLIGASSLAIGGLAGGQSAAAFGVSGELTDLSATDAVRHMVAGELTAERYAEALIARCVARRDLNAFISFDPDRVLGAAREADRHRREGRKPGLLHGLPVPIKDSLNTADYPTSGGTPALKSFRPAADAPLVATLRASGALVLGKTNLHELSYGWTSNNLAFGAVRNPYDPACIPGGSSGGTAAAVAARMAPLGVAEDTEGSIRVPAALCGLAALRPTTRRYSTEGAVPISPLFDQTGPHARCVADLRLFDHAVTGEAPLPVPASLRGVRLAIARRYFFDGLDPEVARITEAALVRLREAGVVFVDLDVPDLGRLIESTTDAVQNHDVRVELPKYLARYGAPVTFDDVVRAASRDIRDTFAHDVLPGAPGFVSEATYHAAVTEHLPALRRTFREYFVRTRAVALVLPATMVTAPRIGDETELNVAGRAVRFDIAVARNIAPGSTAGLPGLVLPAGVAANGLPVALEFDGPAGSDRALLALGAALEKVLPPLPPPRG
jgi:indoleacetamide hydrolase